MIYVRYIFLAIVLFHFFSSSAYCLDINYKRVSASNNKIYVFSDKEIMIAGENGKLVKTYNYGKEWKWIETNTRNSLIAMNFNSNGQGVLNTNSEILFSSNKGENWRSIIQYPDSSIHKSIITKDGLDIIFSKGKNLFRINIKNQNIDTILKTNYVITDFYNSDSIIYLSTLKEFYKISNNNILIKTFVKGHYNSRINTFASHNNNILLGGADTGKNKYANFLMKSSDGGLSFDTVKFNNIGYIHKIVFFDNHFVVMNSWGYLYHYTQNLEFIKSDTIRPTKYLKFSKDIIILKDLFVFNNKLYFCGRNQSYGYLSDSRYKLEKYAPVLYPVPIFTILLENIKKYNNKLFLLGGMGRILYSKDNGISWDIFFPIDTISELAKNSIWYDYRDKFVIFFDSFKYKNGYRFVGINKYTKPLDIYWDTTSNIFTNINKIKTAIVYQKNNIVIYLQKSFVFYSTDSGNNFDSIPFPDSLLKAQNPSILYMNLVHTIIPTVDDEFLLIKSATLNKNDSINNPNQNNRELIFYNFHIKNHSIIVNKILQFRKDYITNICPLPNNKYLTYAFRISNKISILDSNLNKISSKYLNFFPSKLFAKNDFLWIAATQKDSVFITTDGGNTWSYFYFNNDTLLYENKTTALNKIYNLKDNNYILIGSNRITLLSLNMPTNTVEESSKKTENLFLYPNPATDYIDISTSSVIPAKAGISANIKIYDVLGVCVLTLPCHSCESRNLGKWEELPNQVGNDSTLLRIDVSGLAAGVYFVRVGDKVLKFVKI